MGDADDASEAKTEPRRAFASSSTSPENGLLLPQVVINPFIYRCYKRRRKRQTRYIPQEMLFDIFLRLPAQVLQDVMRHVSREWNLMIHSQDFIYHHLRNSTPGIIIQERRMAPKGFYVEMRQGCIEICKFVCGFGDLVLSCYNGLVLASDFEDLDIVYVINPLTRQRAILPPYFGKTGYHGDFCLAFVEASMEYKVVHACGNEPYGPKTHIAVLTIGVDKVWRHIDMEHFSRRTRGPLMSLPLVTGGYILWIGKTFVLTLNVETETIRRFPMLQLPKLCGKFLPMGSSLSLVNASLVNESNKLMRDIWEMNPETGEWTFLLTFDLKPLKDRYKDLFCEVVKSIIPFVWLAVREVLVFSTIGIQRCCIAYNVKTREIQSFELGTNAKPHHFHAHVKSLVRFEGRF